jgi:hypothetical protein
MIDEPQDKDYGTPLSEWLALLPGDLPRDATGLWEIVPAGREGFGFTNSALVDFVRRAIHTLLDAGAIPVRGGKGTDYEWVAQKQYGIGKDEITESIIREWQAMPDDPLVLCGEGVWFARPRPGTKHVKLD